MSASLHCSCGAQTLWSPKSSISYARCINCGRDLSDLARQAATEQPVQATAVEEGPPAIHWSQRMLAALLDPRSIQWMLMLGGGLMVLGLVVWLVSLGIFENTLIVAATLTAGSLLVHAAGCGVALKTRYKTAGHALAFLGCLLLPLNLWFYHAQGLMTLEGKLWMGGVVCCLLYAATVMLLRDPLFLFAVEGGITLTVVLILGQQGVVSDATWLSVVFMTLACISIHAERAFPPEGEPFNRKRFGLPLFWSGQIQLAAALATLLGSQVLAIVLAPQQQWFATTWGGNWLTQNYWLAGSLWLVGAYAYLYSDLVVRRLGWYLYAAVACLIGAELTFIGYRLPTEWMIAIPAFTSLVITLLSSRAGKEDPIAQRLPPLAMLLAGVSVFAGLVQHVLATSLFAAELGWQHPTGWAFLGTMVLVALCNRAMAVFAGKQSQAAASFHLFLSAASVLVAAAGLARCLEITSWTLQAPLVMLVPLAYLIAARLWQGQSPAEPLALSAQVGAGVILLHVLFNTVRTSGQFVVPVAGSVDNLWLGLVFIEATVFYLLYAILFRSGGNIYVATAAACGAVWQLAGYNNVPDAWYTILYAGLGLILLAIARVFHREQPTTSAPPKPGDLLTSKIASFHSANALLSLALLSGMLQALSRLATHQADWPLLSALGLTTLAGLTAVAIAPSHIWRRIYATWSIALAGVSFLTLNVLITLSVWQKAELFAIVLGLILLAASYVGRFMERNREETDHVTLGLWFGSLLPAGALLAATLYHRFATGTVSLPDELGLVAVTVSMLVTGYSWQLRSPAIVGGGSLAAYLLVLVGMLAYFPNVTMGVYLAIGGALLFGIGIVLSIFRDRLSELPQKIASREGVFQVLSWR